MGDKIETFKITVKRKIKFFKVRKDMKIQKKLVLDSSSEYHTYEDERWKEDYLYARAIEDIKNRERIAEKISKGGPYIEKVFERLEQADKDRQKEEADSRYKVDNLPEVAMEKESILFKPDIMLGKFERVVVSKEDAEQVLNDLKELKNGRTEESTQEENTEEEGGGNPFDSQK